VSTSLPSSAIDTSDASAIARTVRHAGAIAPARCAAASQT
jgi:hypothetical protein